MASRKRAARVFSAFCVLQIIGNVLQHKNIDFFSFSSCEMLGFTTWNPWVHLLICWVLLAETHAFTKKKGLFAKLKPSVLKHKDKSISTRNSYRKLEPNGSGFAYLQARLKYFQTMRNQSITILTIHQHYPFILLISINNRHSCYYGFWGIRCSPFFPFGRFIWRFIIWRSSSYTRCICACVRNSEYFL